MKKFINIVFLIVTIFCFTGCTNEISMEDITIYTSVYPIEYVTEKLYSDHSNIMSFYPNDANPYEYKLTNKQINDYSKANLVVYNGLSNERDYIVDMLNNNKKLKIIDSTARIEYTSTMDEIWINPSNLLTIAQNVRNGLKEYVDSNYVKKEIDENYNNLKLEISTLDAELKEMVANAENKTIVISDNDFMFLEKYGFNILSLDKKTITDKTISDVNKLIADKKINYIFTKKDEKESDIIKTIKTNHSTIEILQIDTLNTISNSDKSDKKDYITIMYENIDKLKKELY